MSADLQEVVVETGEAQVEPVEKQEKPEGETAKPEGAEPQPPVDERKFTQAELNAVVEKRLAKERARRDREQEAERRLAALERAAPKPVVSADPAAPKRESFDDYENYIEAKAAYVAEQKFNGLVTARDKAAKEAKEKEDHATAQKAFDGRMTAAATKYPDFQDALETAQTLPITDAMFGAMIRLEEGADLVHYFGTHPAEAHRIAQLHPTVQATEIGKLAAKLPATVSQPASVSKAPEPIEPIGGKTSAASDTPPTNPEEFKRWHDARERAKAQARKRA